MRSAEGVDELGSRIGIDTGGTFTDFVLLDDATGEAVIHKEVSVGAARASEAVGRGLTAILQGSATRPDALVHGTTIGINALLTRRGVRVGLILTAGLRGVYEVGDQSRPYGPSTYDLRYAKPAPLALSRDTREARERIANDGSVLVPLDEELLRASVRELLEQGIEAIAVALVSSYANPVHERRVRAIVEDEAPGLDVTLSSDVANHIREYGRVSTAVANAFLNPIVRAYIQDLETLFETAKVGTRQLLIMCSDGGTTTFRDARTSSVRTLLSGPAAGVVAASRTARTAGCGNAVTLDMGGTSTDVALIVDGRPLRRRSWRAADIDLSTDVVDIETIAAGGGTLASVDAIGMLSVGPASAGGTPGPACYGRGGDQLTVTDADLLLGLLDRDQLLGGGLPLRYDLAEAAAERLGDSLGLTALDVAWGVFGIINVKMGEAIRSVTSARGYDPRDFVLVAYGGAGPVHAAWLAQELGLPRILIPRNPGVHSALGLLASDVSRQRVRTFMQDLAAARTDDLVVAGRQLACDLASELVTDGIASADMTFKVAADLRYEGQGFELAISVADIDVPDDLDADAFDGLRARFDDAHKLATGHAALERAVEIVSLRVVGLGDVGYRDAAETPEPLAAGHVEPVRSQPIHLAGQTLAAGLYRRDALAQGAVVTGPAVITQPDCTVVALPGQRVTVTANGLLEILADRGDA